MESLAGLRIRLATGAKDALKLLAISDDVDFCLAGCRLADGDVASLLEAVRQVHPQVAVGILCAQLAVPKAMGSVAALLKDRDAEALARAIDTIFTVGTTLMKAPIGCRYGFALNFPRDPVDG